MASLSSRYRVEDLRRLVAQLVAGLGVAPNRGAAFASHLLWFEAAGASPFGIASLAGWLDRLETQNIEPGSVGRAHSERAGTAVYDSRGGLPPLELATASGIAAEKARDAGIGVVRVERLGEVGSSAPVAAGLAIGPNLALIVGPDREWSAALPIPGGLPAVYDSVLARASGGSPLKPTLAPDDPFSVLGPWLSAFSGGGAG